MSNPTRPGKGSPIFSLCQKALPAFLPHLTWIPGNGKSINIWEDSVLGGATLSTRQDLRRLKEWTQTNNIHSLWDISTWKNDENKSWSRWEIASLPHELEEEWSSLKEALQGKTPLREKKKDKIGWGSNAGIYTSARGYCHLVPGLQAPQDSAAWKVIWAVKTLPKVDLFVWIVTQNGVLSGENLQKKGWAGPTICPLCCQAEETTIHLLLSCPFASEVWNLTLGLGTLTPPIPQDFQLMFSRWQALCPLRTANQGHLTVTWKSLPKFILWKLWLERNHRIFREEKRTPAQVAVKIKNLFSESATYFIKTSNSKALGTEEEEWMCHLGLQNALPGGPSTISPCN
jgi:hypothetical protein